MSVNLGIMFRREYAPETLPDFARRTEAAGFDELWVVEDAFYTSGIASAATALAHTSRLTVGLGIMPAVARNPVFTAMEIATLARTYPGRFLPGIGHGVAEWMRQIGAFPQSQLRALEEVTVTVRALLAGETVSFDGQQVQLDQTYLVHPPTQPPPVSLGVIGPKSLKISGRVADGTIMAEYANLAYIAWGKKQIAEGMALRETAVPLPDHRLTLFIFAAAAATKAAARQRLRPLVAAGIASGDLDGKLTPMGILPQVRALREAGGQAQLEAEMPDAWIDALTLVGTPDDWQAAIAQFAAAGIHSVVLVPHPDSDTTELDVFAQQLASMPRG